MFLDASKAFDRVDYGKLLSILLSINIFFKVYTLMLCY